MVIKKGNKPKIATDTQILSPATQLGDLRNKELKCTHAKIKNDNMLMLIGYIK